MSNVLQKTGTTYPAAGGGPAIMKTTTTGGAEVPSVNVDNIAYGALPCIKIGATQAVAVGSASAQSAVVAASVVRLVSTTDCFVAFGSNPTANTTTSLFLPANSPEYFQFNSGDKVAVIQNAAAGNLYITAAA